MKNTDNDTSAQASPITTTDLDDHGRKAWDLTRRLAAQIEADPERVITGQVALTCAAVSLLARELRLDAEISCLTFEEASDMDDGAGQS